MNRYTPVDVKDRVYKERALLAQAVRRYLAAHPLSSYSDITKAVSGGSHALPRLRALGLIKQERVDGKPVWSAVGMEEPKE